MPDRLDVDLFVRLFVVLATVAGGAIGTKSLKDSEMGNGSSKAADIAVADAGFRKSSGEQVLIQARHPGAGTDRAALEQAAAQLVQRLKKTPHVEKVVSPFDAGATGYGFSSQDVAATDVTDPRLLVGYHAEVHRRTAEFLRTLSDEDLDRIVDRRWDPPVTLGVRLVSVIGDDLQHAGQAALLRGFLERR